MFRSLRRNLRQVERSPIISVFLQADIGIIDGIYRRDDRLKAMYPCNLQGWSDIRILGEDHHLVDLSVKRGVRNIYANQHIHLLLHEVGTSVCLKILASLLPQPQGVTVATHETLLKFSGFTMRKILSLLGGPAIHGRALPIFPEHLPLAAEARSGVHIAFHLLRSHRQCRIKIDAEQLFLRKKEGMKKIAQLHSIVGIEYWRGSAFFQSRSDVVIKILPIYKNAHHFLRHAPHLCPQIFAGEGLKPSPAPEYNLLVCPFRAYSL